MPDTIKSLKDKIRKLTEQLEKEKSGVIMSPDGGLGGAALLHDFCLYLSALDPGLTVGVDYDIALNIQAAKNYWVENGGAGEDLD